MINDTYEVEFVDEGQDLLRLTIDAQTGAIIDCGPFHANVYALGDCIVNVDHLTKYRDVECTLRGHQKRFKWLMRKVSRNGNVLCEA